MKRKYRGYEYEITETEDKYYYIRPLNFETRTIFIECRPELVDISFKRHIDRVMYYNDGQ